MIQQSKQSFSTSNQKQLNPHYTTKQHLENIAKEQLAKLVLVV
jgi:hypothetical protein